MSPSRPFILRPVATSLLMVAILLAGWVAYLQLPVSALPQVDYPTIQVHDVLSGREPGGDGIVGDGAAGAAVRTDSGTDPDDVDEFGRRQRHYAAVRPGGVDRHRAAGCAGGDQCGYSYLPKDLPNPPVYSKVNPADAPIHDAGADERLASAGEGGRPRRHDSGAEDLAALRRRTGLDQRRTEAGGPHPGEPDGAGELRAEPGRPSRRLWARRTSTRRRAT